MNENTSHFRQSCAIRTFASNETTRAQINNILSFYYSLIVCCDVYCCLLWLLCCPQCRPYWLTAFIDDISFYLKGKIVANASDESRPTVKCRSTIGRRVFKIGFVTFKTHFTFIIINIKINLLKYMSVIIKTNDCNRGSPRKARKGLSRAPAP